MLSTMRGQRWVTLGILALLGVDLALIVAAMWPSSAPALPPATPAAIGSGTATAASSGGQTPSPSASASPSPSPTEVAAAPLTRLVAGIDARIAWVADTGSCGKDGAIHLTTDGGATWTSTKAPAYVTRVRSTSATAAFVVGGGQDCAFALWSTTDGGSSWSGPQSGAGAWGRSPTDAATIQRPGGNPVTPCAGSADVVDLTGIDRVRAAVLCTNGEVRETTDGGSSWATAIDRNRALALSWDGGGSGVLAETSDGCDGISVLRVRAGKAGKETCVVGVTPTKAAVAISSSGGAVWLVAGDRAATAATVSGPWTVTKGSIG